MIKSLFKKLLVKSGKTYVVDERIPSGLFCRTLYRRLIMLIRGFFKTGKKIYVGKNVGLLNKKNISFGKNVTIESYTEIDGYASEKLILGDNTKIGSFSKVLSTSHFSKFGKGLKMGNNSAIGDYAHIGATGGVEIGNDVIMGSYISFHSENHNFTDVSKLIREQGVNSVGIKLGNNIWVGAKVTFLDGVVIGDNCVVAAGALVKGEFPANCVIGGVPAKILKTIE